MGFVPDRPEHGGTRLGALPAAPVVAALRDLQQDMAADRDLPTFAAGLGLDDKFVEALRADRLPASLDVDQIGRVCEALRCSPYDLWGPDLAKRILHAYGPERWPSHIEPFNEGRDLSTPHDEFMARRVKADVARIVGTEFPPAASPTDADAGKRPPSDSAVCCCQEGLLAESPHVVIRHVASTSDAEPGVEAYHFRSPNLARSSSTRRHQSANRPPPGTTQTHTRERRGELPDGALAAERRPGALRRRRRAAGMARLEPDAETWEAWDDPRTHYAGDPADVLDAAGFTDPAPVSASLREFTSHSTESVEMDERHDANVDLDVDPDLAVNGIDRPPERCEPVPIADLGL